MDRLRLASLQISFRQNELTCYNHECNSYAYLRSNTRKVRWIVCLDGPKASRHSLQLRWRVGNHVAGRILCRRGQSLCFLSQVQLDSVGNIHFCSLPLSLVDNTMESRTI
jgi:hypothetical protein